MEKTGEKPVDPKAGPNAQERPQGAGQAPMAWNSDVVAELLRRLDFPFVALVPGSSFRGLHDSLVNYLGNEKPRMLVCLHEEHAVAIAHGYAKATGEPMVAALHSNVGLMHASMAIYDAWCDRAPVMIIGATGPVDAAKRRPWIDWIHTSQDQGGFVRDFTKWDDQPASISATVESLLRANKLIRTQPCGPAYICLDAADQETALETPPQLPDTSRYWEGPSPAAPEEAVARAAEILKAGSRVVMLVGRVSRSEEDWRYRVALAETLNARVVTDLKAAAAFPGNHPLCLGSPGYMMTEEQSRALAEADVILALDWIDLGGCLRQAAGGGEIAAKVINASIDEQVSQGWAKDSGGLAPVDLPLPVAPDTAVAALLAALGEAAPKTPTNSQAPQADPPTGTGPIGLADLARAVAAATNGIETSLLRLPLGWPAQFMPFDHPLDYIGFDGGAGVGSGPGMVVGSALGLMGQGRLPVAILGDGDFVMGANALWTAAHYGIPLLVIVANNQSYFNDELHQERVAIARARPAENRWIGQKLIHPAVDIAALSRSLGLEAAPEASDLALLGPALEKAVAAVRNGGSYVLSVRIEPGYVGS